MNKLEQYSAFKKFLDTLDDTQLQYYWDDLIVPYLTKNKIDARDGFLWWDLYKSKKWPDTYKLSENKLKSDWKLLGQGKSTETIRDKMTGRWRIKWDEANEMKYKDFYQEELNEGLKDLAAAGMIGLSTLGAVGSSEASAKPSAVNQEKLSETDVVAACLVLEAGGEKNSIKGMTAVMNVIQNRAKRGGWWGNTLYKVSVKSKQFECFNNGVFTAVAKAKKRSNFLTAKKIVETAIAGKLPDITNGATSYYANKGKNATVPPQATDKGIQIGNHIFFD